MHRLACLSLSFSLSAATCCTDLTLAETGIAWNYKADLGIEADPAVVLTENFEAPIPEILGRFTGYSPEAFAWSTDRPAESLGLHSLLIHPGGDKLYALLADDYDRLYVRYYIKYVGLDYHHSGVSVGGYWPRSRYPLGDAGLKGIRPDGRRLMHIGLEPMGWGKDNPTAVRLDTYNNWIGMSGQEINGGWWGRSFLRELQIPLRPGTWQCIELMVKMNSAPSSHDGELTVWIDGILQAHFMPGFPHGNFHAYSGRWVMDHAGEGFPGLQWRDTLQYGLNWIKIQNYDDIGEPTDILIDDLVVATQYIGPIHRK